jgi:hypothetical protein
LGFKKSGGRLRKMVKKLNKKEYLKNWRIKNRERIKEYKKTYDPIYYLKNREKKIRQAKEYTLKNIEKSRMTKKILARKYKKMYPEKWNVRSWASNHIKLKEACEIYGSKENLERHHWRYDKPALVNTLCRFCHEVQHSRNIDNVKERLLGGKHGIS